MVLTEQLKDYINSYKDFPKEGIVFRDFLPIFQKPALYKELIKTMSQNYIWKEIDAIIAIDARGFLLGSSISLELNKPLIVARKPGKLPGQIIEKSYNLEYGNNSLSIQKKSIEKYETFGIVDDLLATGGTVKCLEDILNSCNKEIKMLSVVIELPILEGRGKFNFTVESQVSY